MPAHSLPGINDAHAGRRASLRFLQGTRHCLSYRWSLSRSKHVSWKDETFSWPGCGTVTDKRGARKMRCTAGPRYKLPSGQSPTGFGVGVAGTGLLLFVHERLHLFRYGRWRFRPPADVVVADHALGVQDHELGCGVDTVVLPQAFARKDGQAESQILVLPADAVHVIGEGKAEHADSRAVAVQERLGKT